MRSSGGKHAAPESVSLNSDKISVGLPQCHKGMNWSQIRDFLDDVMQHFRRLEDMSDLNSLYQVGKQLSRLYFDMTNFRFESSEQLISMEFPLYSTKMMKKLNNMGVFKNDDIWFSSFYFYNVNWNFSDCNAAYASALATAGLPHLLCLNIGHQPYLDNVSSKNVYYLIKASLSIMHNIVRVPGNAQALNSDTVRRAILQLAHREEEFIRCVASLTMAYLPPQPPPSSSSLTSSSDPAAGVQPPPTEEVRDSTRLVVQHLLHCLEIAMKADKRRHSGFSVEDFLQALGGLATSWDWMKALLLESGKLTHCLKALCSTARVSEMELALRTVWSLALDPQCCRLWKEEQKMGEFLHSIHDNATNLPEAIRVSLQGALWLMEQQHSSSSRDNHDEQPPAELDVFVSYAASNREIVENLCQRLTQAGLKVYCRNETGSGSGGVPEAIGGDNEDSVEISLNALRRSRLLVVALSEGFRQSPRCRLELQQWQSRGGGVAEGGSLTTSPGVVPVVVQYKYRPDTWLTSALVAYKIHHDISGRRDLESSMDQLVNSIQQKVTTLQAASASALTGGGGGAPTGSIMGGMNTAQSNGSLSHSQSNTLPSAISNASSARISRKNSGDLCILPLTTSPLPPASSNNATIPTTTSAAKAPPSSSPLEQWSHHDVCHWLDAHNLGHVAHEFKAMDGRMLHQLLKMRHESPEFFYQSLDTKLRLSLVDILKFCASVESLCSGSSSENDK